MLDDYAESYVIDFLVWLIFKADGTACVFGATVMISAVILSLIHHFAKSYSRDLE